MSRKKQNNQITFMIVPHGKSKTVSLQLSLSHLKLYGMLLLFILLGTGFIMTDYILVQGSHGRLEVEKNELTAKIGTLDQQHSKDKQDFFLLMDQVNEMKAYVQQLEQLEAEFRNKSGSLQLPTSINGGIGGAERLSLDTPIINEEAKIEGYWETERLKRHTSDTLTLLHRELPDKLKKVQLLVKDVEAINRQLIHTPSIYPAIGTITSGFGYRRDPFHGARRFHDGFDIAGHYRSPIYATAEGKVVYADRRDGYGKTIQIVHSQTIQTSYSHLSEIIVEVGDTIKKGQVIGYMGSTGRSTGVHVHYMVFENGQPVDPVKYLPIGRK